MITIEQQSNVKEPLGKLVHQHLPTLERITRDQLFADIWRDDRLNRSQRSLITIAILISQGATEPLETHMHRALMHGIEYGEMCALIEHCAFYAGWGRVESALRIWDGVVRDWQACIRRECTGMCCRD